MKTWIYLTALLLSLTLISPGRTETGDPFNAAPQSGASEPAANPQASCHQTEKSVAAQTSFRQLRLVGILIDRQQPEALFADAEQQVVSVRTGEQLAAEKLLVQSISKQRVELQQWHGDCEHPEITTLTL